MNAYEKQPETITKVIDGVEITYKFDRETETYLPFSDTKEEKIDIGKYGRMRLKFLREQKPIPMTFNQLMINGELEQHLLTVNEQCISRVSEFVEKNREKY